MLIWALPVMYCCCCTGQSQCGEQSGTFLNTWLSLSFTWLTLGTKSALTYIAIVSIVAILQIWVTQKLKEEGYRAILHPSVICYSYYTCWISLQGSFLIRKGHANLPLTPISLQTCTQYAIYSPSYNHSWNWYRAFLGIASSVFLQAPARLFGISQGGSFQWARGLTPCYTRDTAPLWMASTSAGWGHLVPNLCSLRITSTCLKKAH